MQDLDLLYADPDPDQRTRVTDAVAAAGLRVESVDPSGLAAVLADSEPRALLIPVDLEVADTGLPRIVFCPPDQLSDGVQAVKTGAEDLLLLPLDGADVVRSVRSLPEGATGPTLHHSDDQVRTLLEASPVPQLVSRASDGTILYINEPLSTLLGMTSPELLGERTPDFYFDPSDRQFVLDALARDGHLLNHELRIQNNRGEMLWVLSSMVATQLDGEPVIIVGLYEITERKRIEEALRESEEILRQLTDAIDDVFWMYDIETNERVFASAGFLGELEEFEEGTTYLDVAHPEDRDRIQEEMDAAWGKPVKVDSQFRIVLNDGSIRWIRSRGFPILNEKGEVYRYCGLDVDMTERVEQERALQASEEIFKQLTNTIDDVFWMYDLEREEQVFVSPAFEDYYGRRLGKDVSYLDMMHPEDRPRMERVMDENWGKPTQAEHQYRMIRKDGSVRWIQSRSFPILNAEGKVYRYCGLDIDITQRIEQEEALRESEAKVRQALADMEQANRDLRAAQTQLVQAEKMASLGNLVAGVAHEINTPVGAINSMHDTLVRGVEKLRETLADEAAEVFDRNLTIQRSFKVIEEANRVIKTGTDRVTTIVRSLRSFARLDEAEKKEALLSECIDDALTLIRHEVKGRIAIEKDYADLPPIVCFPSRLNQVFLNILVNATQAIEGDGTITIRTSVVEERTARIEITDDGKGMTAETAAKVFDPGFTTKGVGVGTGLGLSICYQIVQDHGGAIRVSSEPGKGTTFTVDLPRNGQDPS